MLFFFFRPWPLHLKLWPRKAGTKQCSTNTLSPTLWTLIDYFVYAWHCQGYICMTCTWLVMWLWCILSHASSLATHNRLRSNNVNLAINDGHSNHLKITRAFSSHHKYKYTLAVIFMQSAKNKTKTETRAKRINVN